jgi:amino acid transporter
MMMMTDFLTAYIGIPIFFGLYLFWKIAKRTSFRNPADADITTGKAALDAEDGQWPERIPRNVVERVWFWIA